MQPTPTEPTRRRSLAAPIGAIVVILAVILDRITQSFGAKAAAPAKSRWAMPAFLHRLMPMPARSNPTH